MKKIFTYSILLVLIAVFFIGCAKEKVDDYRSHWLTQERGEVAYSNNFCGLYVIETNYGYTVIQNVDGLRTYEADVIYGNFGGYGTRDFYNYTADIISRGNVLEYDLTYDEAVDAVDYYCPFGKANGTKLRHNITSAAKIQRPALSVEK